MYVIVCVYMMIYTYIIHNMCIYITRSLYAVSAMSPCPLVLALRAKTKTMRYGLIWAFVRFCQCGLGMSVCHGVFAMAGVSILWHLYPQLSDHAWMPSG